ncbi:MAG: hypothetical protein LC777_22125 [Actinobacteria bacterium]|nr:hypothetical protein [Actinomycetota bacterium]
MPSKSPGYDRFESARRDEDRRYGRERDERDEREEFELELAVADRLTEHASLPPGDPEAQALARHLLGRGPSPIPPGMTITDYRRQRGQQGKRRRRLRRRR